jgi:hypothetical protein
MTIELVPDPESHCNSETRLSRADRLALIEWLRADGMLDTDRVLP